MRFVEPIKDPSKVQEIGHFLWKKRPSYGLFFYLGIYSFLRVSDMINLKVKDVLGSHLELMEKKTGKRKKTLITENLKIKIGEYLRFKYPDGNIPLDSYLFQNKTGFHISRQMANKILKKAAKKFDLKNFASHSLRKTCATNLYKQSNDLGLVMSFLNHRSMYDTLKYLGLNQETCDDAMRNFNYDKKEDKNVG